VVVVMQATRNGARDELANHHELSPNHRLACYALPNPLVRAGVIELRLLFRQSAQMPLALDQ
jgi:hypothetical protein